MVSREVIPLTQKPAPRTFAKENQFWYFQDFLRRPSCPLWCRLLAGFALSAFLAHGFNALQCKLQALAPELGAHDEFLDVSEEVRIS